MTHQLGPREPFGGVGIETDDVLSGRVGSEGPASLGGVHLGQDDLVVGVTDLDVHADAGGGGSEAVGAGIIQLDLVIT